VTNVGNAAVMSARIVPETVCPCAGVSIVPNGNSEVAFVQTD
jgi:hypothetical protein